jgi:hypothetical protein
MTSPLHDDVPEECLDEFEVGELGVSAVASVTLPTHPISGAAGSSKLACDGEARGLFEIDAVGLGRRLVADDRLWRSLGGV